jgi:xanthine dehydrogenase accessory factor
VTDVKENREIVRAMEEMKRSGRRMALATVVRVRGSAYRREGAKLLIEEGGNTVGVISGGCLEPDVAEVAKGVMADGRPALRRYELDEELVWGLGLGCPGTVDIWIEPVSDAAARPLGRDGEDLREERGFQEGDCYGSWLRCLREERAAVLATLLEPSSSALQAGARLLIPQEGEPMGDLGDSSLNRWVIERAREKLDGLYPRSETLPFSLPEGDPMQVFFDVNLPPFELVIFGAGHDAIPVAKYAEELGFRTTVVDPRSAYATEDRFPGSRIVLADRDSWADQVSIGRRTFVLVMNHHLERDRAAIRFALNSPAPYVGVLGPRSRREKMLEALEREGVTFGQEQLARMYNPVGLDIGAETPEEVAISILSEILAFRNGHAGGFLREQNRDRIHHPL